MTNNNHFPEYVNFYPLMAIAAARRASRVGGGYRLYVLAKALDQEGRGSVSRDELRDYALSLGVLPRTWERWIIEARTLGLLWDVQRRDSQWELILSGAATAAKAMKCETVGTCKVTMAADLLIGAGWKARVWAAYEATHNGRPVSREWMQKAVNVPVSTQRYRDVQAGVTRQGNHAKLVYRADALPMLREYGHHKGLYLRKDGFIGARKPDSRYTNLAERGRKGRARKANATLHRMERMIGLSLVRQALSDHVSPELPASKSVCVRLFNFTPEQRSASEKKLAQADTRRIREVYEQSHTARSGAVVWNHCPVL
jgi:hypothetical protein